MYGVCDLLYLVVCHEQAVLSRKFSGCYLQLLNGVSADDVHLCAFIKHDGEWMFAMCNCGDFEGASVDCACEVDVACLRCT